MGAGDQFFRTKADALIAERRKRSSFVMVTHNLNEVVAHCDQVLVLGGEGPELCDNVPQRVKQYINEMNSRAAEKTKMTTEVGSTDSSL
jgi:ABC-type polysaccharide/polyol phosphate transport system ATPase subunit